MAGHANGPLSMFSIDVGPLKEREEASAAHRDKLGLYGHGGSTRGRRDSGRDGQGHSSSDSADGNCC